MNTIKFKADKDYEVDIEDRFDLQDMAPMEIRKALVKVSSQYAYWSSVLNKIKRQKDVLQNDYDVWYARMYKYVDEKSVKKTESYKANQIMLQNPNEWGSWRRKIINATYAYNQCKTIVSAYELQAQTLGSASYMVKVEFNAITKHGDGDLENI